MIRKVLWTASWRRAPMSLLGRASLVGAVVAVGVAVGVASATGPLFLSSVGSVMIAEDLSEGCPALAGLRVTAGGTVNGEYHEGAFRIPPGSTDLSEREDALRQAMTDHGLPGAAQLTAVGPLLDVQARGRTRVRLVHRPDIEAKVDVIESVDGEGVWIPETTSELIDAHAGDEVTVGVVGLAARPVRVAGVYQDLTLPLAWLWCVHSRLAYPLGFLETPQALLLVDRDTFADLEAAYGGAPTGLVWEVPVDANGLTLPRAEVLSDRLDAVAAALRDQSSDLNAVVGVAGASAALPELVAVWEKTTSSVRSGVLPVSAATLLVCLVFVASVARSWSEERSAELALHVSRGVSPSALAIKALLECAAPLVVGVAAGAAVAAVGVRTLGPSSLLDGRGIGTSALVATIAAAIALAVLAGIVARRTRQLEEARPRHRLPVIGIAVELAIAVAAATVWTRIADAGDDLLRAQSGAPPKVDIKHVLFPVLTTVATAALGVRLVIRILPILRRVPMRAPLALYLTSRRLVAGRRALHALVVAATVAAGLFTFSATVVRSIGDTLDAKGARFVGSDVALRLPAPPDQLPEPLRGRGTMIGRWLNAENENGDRIEVIGVDPATFRDAAFWHSSMADAPIESLLDDLDADSSGPLPVLVAGLPTTAGIGVRFGTRIAPVFPLQPVASVDSFPGQRREQLIVVNLAALSRLRAPSMGEIWALGEEAEVVEATMAAGLTVWGTFTTQEIATVGSFRTIAWTFGFVRAVATLVGVLALAGLLAHLAARERRTRLSYAIARRIGVQRRTNVAATLLEMAFVTVISTALGASAGLITASAVHGRLDNLTRLAPQALFTPPWASFAIATAVIAASVVVGALAVQRTADRGDVVELLRAE